MDSSTSPSCSDNSDGVPKFDFSMWNPEAPSGLSFISLLPLHQSYEAKSLDNAPGKSKAHTTHRKARKMETASGRTIGQDIRDERRLKQAVESGDLLLASELLDDGVNPSCHDDKQRTPLHLAAAKGNQQIVNLLLDRGANPNRKDAIGNTPLHLAACTSHVQVVTLLLKAGTDINALDQTGRTPLHLATGRLRLLQQSHTYSHDQLKMEVTNIVDMMKEYLIQSHHSEDVDELETITDRLQATTTKEEIDELGSLLSNFASLQLSKPSTSSAQDTSQLVPPVALISDPPSPAVYHDPR